MASNLTLARKISALERGVALSELVTDSNGSKRGARVIGISGPPGVGKSVLVGQLVRRLVQEGNSVAVLAVDPSSPFTGGAVLADRLRMPVEWGGGRVFVRSLATRGVLGGLSSVVPAAIGVLETEGFDVVVVETVGVGQNETEILKVADTVVIVQAPGAGDDAQAIKAGVLEIADIFVVNKKDLPGSEEAVRFLNGSIITARPNGFETPVIPTNALTGEGIPEFSDATRRHSDWLRANGGLAARRRQRIEAQLSWELWRIIKSRVPVTELAAEIVAGKATMAEAVKHLLGEIESSTYPSEVRTP